MATTTALGGAIACAPAPPPYTTVSVEWTGGVTATRTDARYGPHPMHRADLYLSSGNRGTIVFVHGGGWIAGDKAQGLPSLLRYEVTRGYDVVSINYRLAPSDPFPAAVHDLGMAVKWVREQGPALGLSTARIVLAGHSAGANIAALAAYGANNSFPGGAIPRVNGALLISGAYDFASARMDVFEPGEWLRRLEHPGGWLRTPGSRTAASPVRWLDAGDPATLVIHGDADPIVSVDQARALRLRSIAVGHGSRSTIFEVTTTAFGDHCRGHSAWCGVPLDTVNGFLDALPGGRS